MRPPEARRLDLLGFDTTFKLATAGISLTALLFSWLSFSIARGSFVANNRSWLIISKIEVLNVSDNWSNFAVTVENIGKSPANFVVETRLSGNNSSVVLTEGLPKPPSTGVGMTIAPGQHMVVEEWPEWEERSDPPPRLLVSLIYRDGTTRSWRRSQALYMIGGKVERKGVSSLVFDRAGRATGEALLLNQRMV